MVAPAPPSREVTTTVPRRPATVAIFPPDAVAAPGNRGRSSWLDDESDENDTETDDEADDSPENDESDESDEADDSESDEAELAD
jgi:hypothetical protein